MLQQKINAVRRMAKIWVKIQKLKTETSRQIDDQLQSEATKLQLDPHCLQTQLTCRNLKAKLAELQVYNTGSRWTSNRESTLNRLHWATKEPISSCKQSR